MPLLPVPMCPDAGHTTLLPPGKLLVSAPCTAEAWPLVTAQCWKQGRGEKRGSGARNGVGGRGEDALTATGARRDLGEAQGVCSAKSVPDIPTSPCQPCTQLQQRAKETGTGATGCEDQGWRLPSFPLETEPQELCSLVPL